jgi:RHS repeat-associated protein
MNLGLLDFGARNLDKALGRWLGVDPKADHPNQVDKSPYSAFWNNPIKYDDPDGQCPFCPWLDAVVDVGFVLYDAGVLIHEKVTTGFTSSANWAALGADGASILVPMSVGAGQAVKAGIKAVNKTDNAVDVVKTTSKVVENAKQGKQFEGVVTENLKQTGHKNVAEQVTVKPNGGGKNVRLDNVSKKDGQIKLTDAKSSATAPHTNNQKTGYPEIEKNGGTVVGKGKPGYPRGTKIPPTKIDIIRPKDINQ